MDLKEKNILIAGAGLSGKGAAKLLLKGQITPTIYDGNEQLDTDKLRQEIPGGEHLAFLLGKYQDQMADDFDLLILSPGISVYGEIAQSFLSRNKPVWGEIELAWYFSKGRIAAITGTNGKTTTTALVGSILKNYYESVFVVGNIGIPFASVATETTENSVIAAEISSFQLETAVDFCPEVSAVLNVTPDHLDRHKTMENYADTKLSISKNQDSSKVIVLNYDDPITREMGEKTSARPVYFSRKEELPSGIILKDGNFVIRENEAETVVCNTGEINLLGGHNHENILAAIGICYYMGVPVPKIKEAVMAFRAVEHRIEYVDTVDGVDYYNDSKGTNPDAAIKGIQAMVKKTVLLGGGYDKGASYDQWISSFDGKVKCLIVMGATADAIEQSARSLGFEEVIHAQTLEEAMEIARQKALPGEAVLLSPACASWGMFKNYEVRGQVFKEIVRRFKEQG